MKIWFYMEGTIADLYGVENWLEMLIAHDETPRNRKTYCKSFGTGKAHEQSSA